MGKYLQEADGVMDAAKVGVVMDGFTEVLPNVPGGMCGVLAASGDSSGCNFLNKAKFMAYSSSLLGWTSFQESCTGCVVFK